MRLLFTRATGLGNISVEPGQIATVSDPAQVRQLITAGRAVPARGEDAPVAPIAITTESFLPPEPPKETLPPPEVVQGQKAAGPDQAPDQGADATPATGEDAPDATAAAGEDSGPPDPPPAPPTPTKQRRHR